MKQRFYKAAKEIGADIISYKTYRSDMGCQVYDIVTKDMDGGVHDFADSLWVGGPEKDKADLIEAFKKEVKFKTYKRAKP
ncbi:hypothetical protein [Pedobacter africanus]|uniref:Uncharacterized protein n=1 Tax=Pedobacter africanus TaxID=151894 RepID=A0A1W1ZCY9_9SPHI|nr:hypothetical protein [Pedobacter africanus]SMC46021.1 hypothetical protein SAMN04488524_0589 [Pedobacter africanus]